MTHEFDSSTGAVEIVIMVDGVERTYRCGRHEVPKEVGFFSVFENTEVVGVRDTSTKEFFDWDRPDVDEIEEVA